MKSVLKYSLVAAIPAVLAAPFVYAASSATGVISANIIAPLSVSETGNGLGFGSVTPGSSSGTVSTATKAVTGGVTPVDTSSITSDAFTVTGNTGSVYTVSGASPVTITSGSHTMSVALVLPSGSQSLTNGTGSFNVDGVLTVGANQVAGTYTGQYTVSVSY